MAQEKVKELSTANTVRAGGKVRPQEPVKIYAAKSKAGAHLGEPGTEHTVHAVLAHKLVTKGAAVLTPPKKADTGKVELTKEEKAGVAAQLEINLGVKPTADQLKAALAEALDAKANPGGKGEDDEIFD